ncbi:MAG: beta strand repeat-containing protein, partial [bacterium]
MGNGTDTAANLGLSQAELNNITAGTLVIGNNTTGSIVNTASISRANATLGTNLTLISGNSISQSGAGNLTISGMANFVAGGSGASADLTLNNATNNFGTVTATGANITIADASALTITDIVVKDSQNQNGNGTVSITAQNLTLTGNLIAGLAGVVNLLPTAGLIVDLGVKSTGNFGLLASEINRITAGTLVIGSNTAGAILNTVPIDRSNATLGRNLTLISGSTITQTDGNLSVAGMANFVSNGTGTSGNITLNNLTNNFYSTGCIASSGTNITIINSNATVLARTVASGCLTVNSPSGAITQATGTSISVAGMANFVSSGSGTSGNITLNNATNNFTTITASGTNITIVNSNSSGTQLGTVNATGCLTVNATNGPITQAVGTNLTVNGTASFVTTGTGTSGNITLLNLTNKFGRFDARGTNISVSD